MNIRLKRFLPLLACLLLVGAVTPLHAYPYGGWGGYRGWGGWGYRGWGYGPGWYGTGIPNGLGWTMFGVAAAGSVAATAAAVAPLVYGPPAYAAPVYAAPAYVAPAPASISYYQPPQSAAPAPAPSHASQHSVDPPSNTLTKAEKKLAGLGYYKGPVDGEYGPAIQQSIQQFQTDNGLPVSGRLDLKTLSSLGISL